MTPAGEGELIEAARAGSAAAFSRLVQTHQQSVRGFLRRLTGSHADADDMAQEAFVTAWSRMAAFRSGESFRSWVCGIAWRKWLTHRRGEARRGARETESAELGETPSSGADASQARLDAAQVLGALPPDQRACVALCLAAEFSHAEAAEALGLPLGTVKSHVTRGRARLLELLEARHVRA
jgi:RNA polymerase sigma-70 factor (ECF subfamily)